MTNEQINHKPGCDALGGYGHGVGPCTCKDAAGQGQAAVLSQEPEVLMATAEVRNHGVEITIGLTQEEAGYLKAMMQNSNVTGRWETPCEENIRRVIFTALKDAGVD